MWEQLIDPCAPSGVTSHRMKVPGGWIIRTVVTREHGGAAVSMFFYADSVHAWELQK